MMMTDIIRRSGLACDPWRISIARERDFRSVILNAISDDIVINL
jgi:hypothetical protein